MILILESWKVVHIIFIFLKTKEKLKTWIVEKII